MTGSTCLFYIGIMEKAFLLILSLMFGKSPPATSSKANYNSFLLVLKLSTPAALFASFSCSLLFYNSSTVDCVLNCGLFDIIKI